MPEYKKFSQKYGSLQASSHTVRSRHPGNLCRGRMLVSRHQVPLSCAPPPAAPAAPRHGSARGDSCGVEHSNLSVRSYLLTRAGSTPVVQRAISLILTHAEDLLTRTGAYGEGGWLLLGKRWMQASREWGRGGRARNDAAWQPIMKEGVAKLMGKAGKL